MHRFLLASALMSAIASSAALAAGGLTIITPYGSTSPYGGLPLQAPTLGGLAYPPGAQTCVAESQTCKAHAPNTVGSYCTCTTSDGRALPGIVH